MLLHIYRKWFFFLALYGIFLPFLWHFTTYILFLTSHLVWFYSWHAQAQQLRIKNLCLPISSLWLAVNVLQRHLYDCLCATPGQSIWKWLRLPNVWFFLWMFHFSGYQLVGRTITLGKSKQMTAFSIILFALKSR